MRGRSSVFGRVGLGDSGGGGGCFATAVTATVALRGGNNGLDGVGGGPSSISIDVCEV